MNGDKSASATGHAHAQQRQCREQPARRGVGATSWPRNGCASMVWSIRRRQLLSAAGTASLPFCRNGLASGRRTVRKCSLSAGHADAARSAAVASAASGIRASTDGDQQVAELGKVPIHFHSPAAATAGCHLNSRSVSVLTPRCTRCHPAPRTMHEQKASLLHDTVSNDGG